MFFNDEDERFLNPELLHIVRREIYAISNLEVTPYALRSAPTHTEDGIPIRKLYVSNLPPKTTRSELFGIFAQYGIIKSCWLRMGDKGPHRSPTPTYAFVTYSNPADAHKALQAPNHEKCLRGRSLRTAPADSWHQPSEDATGRVHWKTRNQRPHTAQQQDNLNAQEASGLDSSEQSTSEPSEATSSKTPENVELQEVEMTDSENDDQHYNILDILNMDCLTHILSYIPIRDLIRSERVSKRWQHMVEEYLEARKSSGVWRPYSPQEHNTTRGILVFKTSWWPHAPVMLTTAVLRRLLQRAGGSLQRLHIDHHWSALNDRTAHTVGKFCPNLEELKVVGMHTKNWNPLIYGCKQLKSLSFVSCNKLTDSSLVQLVKGETCIERLLVANNTHVTGLFLTGANPPQLNSLAFYNCYSLQGTVLCAALDTLPSITTLKLDVCPVTMWKVIPRILQKLPKLEELSLSEYTSVETCPTQLDYDSFCKAIATLSELKVLNLSRNIYITNAALKQVAQSCPKLENLNISSCNSRKGYQLSPGVSDAGVEAVWAGCARLAALDVSYLAGLSDAGLAGCARLAQLESLTVRGNPALSAAPLAACVQGCPLLRALDACGCDAVSEELVCAAERALRTHPRALQLHLAGTAAAQATQDFPRHKLLTVNTLEDRSNPHLRPDFVDRLFDDSSENSLEDIYNDEFDDFFGPDVNASEDELFLDDEMAEYEGLYAYGVHAPDIIIL